MKLVITVCATGSYCYAMKTLARRVAACLAYAEWTEPGVMIIAGDNTRPVKEAAAHFKAALPDAWKVTLLDAAKENTAEANYKVPAQLIIAQLRSAAFTEARTLQPDMCWSLDSDTLPPANALQCMLDSLRFDKGFYAIATCPYPNEAFLGGFGSQQTQINQDFLDSERIIPEDIANEKADVMALLTALAKEAAESKETTPPEDWIKRKDAGEARLKEVDKKIRECPPTGTIWEVIAKHGWRRRGWLDQAYPAIGRGSMVPSDWCGFGCTLMSRAALALADFDGYAGEGTEDLFVIWNRWYPARLRISVITHCPCDHVIWAKKRGGDEKAYTLVQSFHEEHGECLGHLRTRKLPWREF